MVEESKNNINNETVPKNDESSDEDITYFAQTNFRNERRSFGIKRKDRTKHSYVIGKTGMGKTTVLENMAIQDIQRGEGVGIVDPHGSFAEKMLDFVPQERVKDVVYFCPQDTDWPMAFNVMEDVGIEYRHLVASGLMGVFKKIWPDVWSPRMEYILNNAILALLEYPDSTILGINRMLSDKDYRKEVVSKVTDSVVKAFWEQEFAKYTDRFMTEAGAAIQNKVGQFISNPLIRNIIGQPKSSFDMRKIMDEKKILIMNLSKGRIGEDNSRLIGAMLITKIYLGAMSRVDVPEKQRADFYLYVDEFQNFATESFKDILSEARKYRLNLILAHQYIAQMEEKTRDAVFGNVGTLVVFRVGAFDAEVLETEFAPEFTCQDIVNLGFASVYLKLMINGVASRPFSALTLPPIPLPEKTYTGEIIRFSREKYASPKEDVEKRITEWHAPVKPPEKPARPDVPKEGESFVGTGTASGPEKWEEREVKREGPQLFDATCTSCGIGTKVPFRPDNKRPIYCKDCKVKYLAKAVSDGSKAAVGAVKEAVDSFKNVFSPPFGRSARPEPSRNRPEPRLTRPMRRIPSISEGEIVQKSDSPADTERISLESLKRSQPQERSSAAAEVRRKPKVLPDLSELRKVLDETLEKVLPEEVTEEKKTQQPEKKPEERKNILRPGDSIKF